MTGTNIAAAAFFAPFALAGIGIVVALLLRRYIARLIEAERRPDDGPWSGGYEP